jgi:hypothetical protein
MHPTEIKSNGKEVGKVEKNYKKIQLPPLVGKSETPLKNNTL